MAVTIIVFVLQLKNKNTDSLMKYKTVQKLICTVFLFYNNTVSMTNSLFVCDMQMEHILDAF